MNRAHSDPRYRNGYDSLDKIPIITPPVSGDRRFTGNTTGTMPSQGQRSQIPATSATFSSRQLGNVIVALIEGTGKAGGEVGLAAMDIETSHLILSQFPDSTSYTRLITKLEIYEPKEIVVSQTNEEGKIHSMLIPKLIEHYDRPLTALERKLFNSVAGLNQIKSLCCPSFASVQFEVSTKYYALAAAAALLHYIQAIQNIAFVPNGIKITCTNSENTVLIDTATAKSLELLVDLSGENTNSLFGLLHHTVTKSGTRLLRASILEPSRDLPTICNRQDCINELSSNPLLRESLSDVLKSVEVNVDLVLANMVQFPRESSKKALEQRIDTVIFLKHVLNHVDKLQKALSYGKHPLWVSYAEMMSDRGYAVLITRIAQFIREDCEYAKRTSSFRVQKCYAVRDGLNPILDVARKTFSEVIEDINKDVDHLREKYQIKNLRVTQSASGYHMECEDYPGNPVRLSNEFIKVAKRGQSLAFTTQHIMELNNRVSRSQVEIFKMSGIVIDELLQQLKDDIGLIYSISEILTKCDFLLSLTIASANHGMVKPRFGDSVYIKDGVHPVLLKMSEPDAEQENPLPPPVTNNTFLKPSNNFQLIFGPNMSGKSIFLKQVALLQIMAQMGSFVPATAASFRLTDRIMSRVGSDDDIESNCSTFAKELLEIQYIIENATDDSLIIIDELGRGTSEEEGVGFCFAIMEHLLQTKAFVLAATHFLDLKTLQNLYYNVCIYQFSHVVGDARKHKLEEEHHQLPDDYGITLAAEVGLPASVIADAHQILAGTTKAELSASHINNPRNAAFLGTTLRVLWRQRANIPNLQTYLKEFKQQFLAQPN